MALNTSKTDVRRPREILKNYYGLSNNPSESSSANSNPKKKTSDENGARGNPCDINGSNFDPEMYLDKLLKEKTLTELVDKEHEMVRNIRTLDSDMQTLVYENYNKFISATDTIRKMKSDFKKMEDEMDNLAKKMDNITEFSSSISATLQDRRQKITKLSGVHTLLKKLQFLFDLPNKLQKCIDEEQYVQAVRYHLKARKVLHQYQHMPSFQGIQHDCSAIVQLLVMKLRQQFNRRDCSPKQLAECVDLLLQLNEPADVLCDEFLAQARERIEADLSSLQFQLNLCSDNNSTAYKSTATTTTTTTTTTATTKSVEDKNNNIINTDNKNVIVDVDNVYGVMDILEFVDSGCNGFLSNICLVVASYNDMFLNRHQEDYFMDPLDLYRVPSFSMQLDAIALKKLIDFVNELMERYFHYVKMRVQLEKTTGNNMILVRSLDRFYRRLQAMNKLLPDSDFSRAGTELVAEAGRDRVKHYFNNLQLHLSDCLTDIRQNLASSSSLIHLVNDTTNSHKGGPAGGAVSFGEMVKKLHTSLIEQVKSVLVNLQAFIHPDITFAMKQHFRSHFCLVEVRENLVVAFVRHIIQTSLDFIHQTDDRSSLPSNILLILCRLCIDLEQLSIGYLLTLVDEQFQSDYHYHHHHPHQQQLISSSSLPPTSYSSSSSSSSSTSSSTLCAEARTAAQQILNHYVKVQGVNISQMLRKSVETRDCLTGVEPRNVRAVMKRVIEDVNVVDRLVGQLFEEGVRNERLSDSTARRSAASRLIAGSKPQWSYAPSTTMDSSLMSNIQKLFYEKIEVFTPIEFTRVSIMTGVIKICLKTLLECVRLKTFGRYGLQQMQVDCYYLQLYLWRYVHDENLVHILLDEVVSSTMHRCLDPVVMEASVVDLICEKG